MINGCTYATYTAREKYFISMSNCSHHHPGFGKVFYCPFTRFFSKNINFIIPEPVFIWIIIISSGYKYHTIGRYCICMPSSRWLWRISIPFILTYIINVDDTRIGIVVNLPARIENTVVHYSSWKTCPAIAEGIYGPGPGLWLHTKESGK